MFKQRIVRKLLVAVLGVFVSSAMAQEVAELEPNNTISSSGLGGPQHLTMGSDGSVTVRGVITNSAGSPDADFYSFDGFAGNTIEVDIDEGLKASGSTGSVDTVLTLFGPAPTYRWLHESNDLPLGTPNDEGSLSRLDPRFEYTLPADGRYFIAVTPSMAMFNTTTCCGIFRTTTMVARNSGSYKLVIKGVKPSVVRINIDVKPGSNELAPINLKSKGTIPVALLSSKEFNALDVDVTTLTFGAEGNEPSLRRCGKEGEDVNGDGLADLVCHFDNQAAKFTDGHDAGIVKGKTKKDKGAVAFEGNGMLKVIPVHRPD